MNTITYHSINSPEAVSWIAFVLLPNGQPWQISYTGATEALAIDVAIAGWNEQAKKYKLSEDALAAIRRASDDPWAAAASGRGAQFIGKKWIRNSAGEKKRVDPIEAEALVASGLWQYGGPRG